MRLFVILCLVLAFNMMCCRKFSSLDNIYFKGLSAYSKERWSECIVQFEESIHLYKLYNSINNNCRQKCKNERYKTMLTEDFDNLRIFELFFNTKDCLTHCQKHGFEDVNMYDNVTDTILYKMQHREPYGYLHMCYYQMNQLPRAASAAFTYLRTHPDDIATQNNVQYYMDQPEVDTKEITDLESKDYEILYNLGLEAYAKKQWGETIATMEEVITDYISWENNCRAACEKQSDPDGSSEFTISISNKMESLLLCCQNCQKDLNVLYNSGVEFLADILNYLQISYYNFNRLEDAVKMVATYLLLLPDDEDMIENKKIYLTLIDKTKFVERSDIAYYYKRDINEKQLLNFFHKKDNNHQDKS